MIKHHVSFHALAMESNQDVMDLFGFLIRLLGIQNMSLKDAWISEPRRYVFFCWFLSSIIVILGITRYRWWFGKMISDDPLWLSHRIHGTGVYIYIYLHLPSKNNQTKVNTTQSHGSYGYVLIQLVVFFSTHQLSINSEIWAEFGVRLHLSPWLK